MISLGELFPISTGGLVYNVDWVEIGIMITFITLCIKSWEKGLTLHMTGFKQIYLILFFSCFLYSILTFYWSDLGLSVLVGSLSLFYGMIAFIIGENYYHKNDRIYPIANRILVTSLLIQLVYNMASGAIYGMDFYAMKQQSTTLLGNSNYIAFFFSFGLLYELIAKEKGWKLFSVINLCGVVLTMSRGAILSIIVSLLIYFLVSIFNKKIKKTHIVISLALISLVFFLFINYTIPGKELMIGLQYGSTVTSSFSSRTILWNDTIEQIKSQPFGIGINWRDAPHDVMLTAFKDLGIVFGSVYILLLAYPLFYFLNPKIFKRSNKSLAVLIAYLSVFVHSMLEIFYFNNTSLIWTVMTLTYINKIIGDEKKQPVEVIEPIAKPRIKPRRKIRITW